MLDEVLVSVFKAPKTYTKEDVVEINCHGGLFVTNKVYELLISLGARPSEAGEFTKRAFLNGRIDLTKAEAVMDMISAENNAALAIASKGLQGVIKRTVDDLRQKLLDVIAVISVNIDYPEYDDVEMLTTNQIKPGIELIISDVINLLEKSKSAKFLKNGVDTAIVGKPNVGKSSLLNALLEEQKAIVTSIPGTTRDTIEAKYNIGNITLNLIDTAGIRETKDIVEKIGVDKSLDMIEKAELILFVVDGSKELDQEDLELYNKIKDKKHLVIINKNDLGIIIDTNKFANKVIISTNDVYKLEELKKSILKLIEVEKITNKDITYLSNARQIEKLNLAKNELLEAMDVINENAFIDFVDIHLRAAWMYLGEIIGETSSESLLDELFSKFCLGK
jgi:tRNA modification GTPase